MWHPSLSSEVVCPSLSHLLTKQATDLYNKLVTERGAAKVFFPALFSKHPSDFLS
jgi:hypothetical protein